jgi:hypothetical protein
MPHRRPRLTAADIENIFDAMGFVLAGEFPFAEGEDDKTYERRLKAFQRTHDKIARSF